MRSKLLNITSRLLGVLIVIAVTIVNSSCSDTETTDSTKFTIYYTGMTDIGPSMTGVISSPTYKGGTPYDFAITRITLDGEPFSDSIFAIDSETGKITLNSTSNTPVGLYKLSVACYSNNNRYEYTDIVEINMMKPVPDGIKTDPEKLQVEYADIIDTESSNELPTSQIRTEGNHISISNYTIASAMWNGVAVESPEDYFAVSDKGEISIIKGNQNIQPGKYILSFKLTTAATGEDPEKGIFENALEINVTSRPLSLIYTPDEGKIEEEGERSPETTFQSNIPALKGSAEGLVYSISSVSPNTDKITIDPTTGVLSVAAHHGFKDGEKYQISVKAINEFSPEGVVFENVFTLNTVEFIEPIANFGYADVNDVQAVEIDINKNENFKGDEVKYDQWKNSPAIRAYMTKHNLKTPAELQVYFTNEISNMLAAKGKRMMGWNEITGDKLHEYQSDADTEGVKQELASGTIVHFWKGDTALIRKTIEKGYDVVNSYHEYTYLDYSYEAIPMEKAYSFNPVPEGLTDDQKSKVLGLGCQMWGEFIPTVESMNLKVYPRLAAYAETGWTDASNKDYQRFLDKLNSFLQKWKTEGITCGPVQ